MPKLRASAEYGPVVTPTLKVAAKDVNVMVTSKALQVLAALASGLRAAFQPHARALVPELLPKFKEKKRAVVSALTDLLLTLHRHCVRLDEVEDALQVGTRHRLPQVRVGTLEWIKQCMEKDPVRCAAPGAIKVAVAELEANLGEPCVAANGFPLPPWWPVRRGACLPAPPPLPPALPCSLLDSQRPHGARCGMLCAGYLLQAPWLRGPPARACLPHQGAPRPPVRQGF